MVFPLIPIAIATLGGFAGGTIMSWLGGGTKKEAAMETVATQETVTRIEPYAFYSPTVTEAWQYTPTIVMGSPEAVTTVTPTKKETITQQPQFTPQISAIPTISPGITQVDQAGAMASIMPLALIGVGGLILYGWVSKKK